MKPNVKCFCGSGKKHKKCGMIYNQLGGLVGCTVVTTLRERAAITATAAAPNQHNTRARIEGDIRWFPRVHRSLNLGETSQHTRTIATASKVLAQYRAALASKFSLCSHGSLYDHFHDTGVAYEDVMRDIIMLSQYAEEDDTRRCTEREIFVTDHKEKFVDLNFARYLFAVCTSQYLENKNLTNQTRELLSVALEIKYLYARQFEHQRSGGPAVDHDQAKRYRKQVYVGGDRGIINCLSRETKAYCTCMDDMKREAESMKKTEICGGCNRSVPRKGMLKCSGCNYLMYCNEECQNKHWPEHKHDCSGIAGEYEPIIPASREDINKFLSEIHSKRKDAL